MSDLPYGLVHGEPAETYHAAPGVTNHRLLDFAKPNVPLLYYRRHVTREAPDTFQSKALGFGEYFHALALEGEAVADARFVTEPAGAPRKPTEAQLNAAKPSDKAIESISYWAEFNRVNAGKTIISRDDRNLAWTMLGAIRSKPKTRALFDHGKPEVVARHKMGAFTIQTRLDWFDERLDDWGRPLIVDVKTIDSLANFSKQFQKFNYWRQAAFYQLVVYETMKLQGPFPRFKFVVIEKEEPHQCMVWVPGEISLDMGRKLILQDLARIKVCYETGIWPGTPDEEEAIELPEWMQIKGGA